MGVITIMPRYRNRKHLVDLLGATEHAAAYLIGSTGKYRGHWDAMPKQLKMRLKIDNPHFPDYISPPNEPADSIQVFAST